MFVYFEHFSPFLFSNKMLVIRNGTQCFSTSASSRGFNRLLGTEELATLFQNIIAFSLIFMIETRTIKLKNCLL